MSFFTDILNSSPKDWLPTVNAYGWVPFVVAILLSLVFSTIYVKYFWCRSVRNKCTQFIPIIGISIAIFSSALLPVDVFLVSFMKNSDGTFKEWATNATRQEIEDTVAYTYYTSYGIIFFYTFFILPLAYFCYEERDDDRRNSFKVFFTALMYTFVFILVVSGLLIAGVFIPFRAAPPKNSTEWEKMEFLIKEMYYNRGQEAMAFLLNCMTIYGMLNLIFYTSVGLGSYPITMIKGFRSLSEEEFILSSDQATTQSKINVLRSKQSRKQLTAREISTLAELEEEESLISRRSSILEVQKKSWSNKCRLFIRTIDAILGIIGLVFSLVLFISLLLNNIDRLMHSLGIKMGYILKEHVLPNPLDYVMVQTQKVFPLDYIMFFAIIIFLLICTVSGIRYMGICCLCVPMYKIRPHRTSPQGLIMLSFVLMFCVLAFNILITATIPTYATFGSQYYCKPNNSTSNSTCDLTACSLSASNEDCVMTRAAAFTLNFAYKAFIFAATYFWLTWAFLAGFVVSFIVIWIRSKPSSLEEAVDKDDFDESEEHMVRI